MENQIVSESGANVSVYWAIQAGGHTLAPGVGPGQGILCEMLLTAILISTVNLTAVDEDGKTVFAPLMIGLTVVADILAGGERLLSFIPYYIRNVNTMVINFR